jgi:hypothetical protein
MPGFDGTGPRGQGPFSGRGRGNCVVPEWSGRIGYGSHGGFGRGWRHRFLATGVPGRGRWNAQSGRHLFSPENEADELKREADYLQKELDSVRRQIEKLTDVQSKEEAEK